MPRQSSFQNFTDQPSGVAQGLVDSTRPPVRKFDVNRVLKEYKLGKVKTKGKSDSALFKVARNAVIDWFERQEKAKRVAKRKRRQQRKRVRRQERQWDQAMADLQRAAQTASAPAPAAQPKPAARKPAPAPTTRTVSGTRHYGGHFIP